MNTLALWRGFFVNSKEFPMSKYQDLQKQAASLGMEKVVGASTDELITYIEEHSNDDQSEGQRSQEKSVVETNEVEYNLAIVLDGAREVRRYDVETHGESFAKLAREFASNRGFDVEMGTLAGKIECPNCGHTFN